MQTLLKYQQELTNKLSDSTVPSKHTNRVKQYKEFLASELKAVTKKIEGLKMNEVKK